jgi:hypothetical protein
VLGLGLAAIVAAAFLWSAIPGLPSLNPFGTETRDRSQPVVLKSLERLSEFRAASANLQAIVDVERDSRLLPSFIKGERTLIVAAGTVDGAVDFRRLGEGAVEISDDRREATLTLPAATLSKPRLDLRRTRVFDRDRGVLDRLGSVLSDDADAQRELLVLSEDKLAAAAREDPDIRRAAERNTRAMLEGMLGGLGFERVTVRFEPGPV